MRNATRAASFSKLSLKGSVASGHGTLLVASLVACASTASKFLVKHLHLKLVSVFLCIAANVFAVDFPLHLDIHPLLAVAVAWVL